MNTSDVELTAGNSQEYLLVLIAEEVKSFGRVIFSVTFFETLFRFTLPTRLSSRVEMNSLTMIGSGKYFFQRDKAINAYFHMSNLRFMCSVTVFYLAVVFNKGNVIGCGFDPQGDTKFIVQSYRCYVLE